MSRWVFWAVVAVVVVVGVPLAVGYGLKGRDPLAVPRLAFSPVTGGSVVARGRIEPEGGVVAVSGPPESLSTVAIVDKLMVEQGSKVAPGQVLAVLSGYDLSRADLAVSEANLQVARLTRAQLQGGAGKRAEIAAQRNVLAARRVQLGKIERDLDRASALVQRNVTSASLFETQKAAFDQITQEVEQVENVIRALSEVRPVDDALAAGQVAVAEATVAKARAATERLQIKARTAGTVLSIQTRGGEVIGADGILRLGDLDRLIVVAEVDETQVGKIKLGMGATIEGVSLAEPIAAKVSRIGQETNRQRRPTSDILVGRDARIVEVELTPSKPLPAVVGAEVAVRFTGAPAPGAS